MPKFHPLRSGLSFAVKPPAFQFYPADFIEGTCDLSAADVGAYIRLLCYQWSRGDIPLAEAAKLERIAGFAVSPDVLAKFPEGRNARMEEVRRKQDEYRQQQADKGRASAKARFNRGSTVVQPTPQPEWQPNGNSPSPSPSPSLSLSFSSDVGQKRSAKASPASDDEWIESLSKSEAYIGLDVKREYAKAGHWCGVKRRKLTRKFFLGWLNRAERPMTSTPNPLPPELNQF